MTYHDIFMILYFMIYHDTLQLQTPETVFEVFEVFFLGCKRVNIPELTGIWSTNYDIFMRFHGLFEAIIC